MKREVKGQMGKEVMERIKREEKKEKKMERRRQ